MRDCSDINQTIRELRDENVIYHFSRDYLRNVMKDAADAIEELLDELTTIRKQLPHWISVEERLPDHRKRVLAIYANGVISTGRVFHNGFPEAYDGFDENGDFKAVPVTHWMPLPAPPKGVE